MKLYAVAILALALVACKDSTAPKGIDPTALVRNSYTAPIFWYWNDGAAVTGGDTIPAHTTRCEQFLAQPDSARFTIVRSDTLAAPTGWSVYTSNYFNPAARDFWTVDATGSASAQPGIIVRDTAAAPCP